MSSRCTCGFWEVIHAVSSPVPGFQEAHDARGSIALGISRWLTRRCTTTWAADLMAASVLSLSPIDHRKATLPGAFSWSWGAPGATAFSPSVTDGSAS
jgi:hypothetical protein